MSRNVSGPGPRREHHFAIETLSILENDSGILPSPEYMRRKGNIPVLGFPPHSYACGPKIDRMVEIDIEIERAPEIGELVRPEPNGLGGITAPVYDFVFVAELGDAHVL